MSDVTFKDGRKLLIEYDAGQISPDNIENKKILSEMKDLDYSQDLILYAVLQKYDTPNKNGRIYPEAILKRENEKYQKFIENGTALNELNHPSCQTKDAKIMTKNGWKNIDSISDYEEILTLNERQELEYKKIYEKKVFHYNGKMIRIKGRNINTLVTPNHKFPIINKNTNKLSFITAKEIQDRFKENNKLSNFYIPKKSFVDDFKYEEMIIKGTKNFNIRATEEYKTKFSKDVNIPMDIFMSFMGIFLSEGYTVTSRTKKRNFVLENLEIDEYESSDYGYTIGITQKKPEIVDLIEELLSLMPFEWKKYKKQNGCVDFKLNDSRLYNYLKPLGKAHEKYIPTELKNTSKNNLNLLLDWYKVGDGRTIGKHKQSDIFSTSEKLINDLQEILIKSGGNGNIRKEVRNTDRYIIENGIERLIKGENTKDMWFLNIGKSNGIYLDNRFITITEEDYDDNVYCVDVPNHTYYSKENEKCFWSGNSSLIDLDRVSHSILETWWEGKILMGKIKIFTSPGWRKMGIVSTKGDQAAMLLMNGATLGISSRGVGSLKSERGQNIVQDDFELVCFDLVSSPSTPGAYVFKDPKDREKYQESIEEKPVEDNKIKNLMSKLDNFLSK